jgi:hypothetical protein
VLVVTIVHGTFPRGLWLQLRRNLRALWTGLLGRQVDEAVLWPAPASQSDRRGWFENGSEFERDLVRRSELPPGCIVFDRFLWSGCNTFADRAEAARSLRAALRESISKHPNLPHLVLAHSHGGTVAVKALDTRNDSRGGGETPAVRALLTLATPFVRLVWRWPMREEDAEHGFARVVAVLLPAVLLLLAPLIVLDFGLSGEGVANTVAAVVLGIAALAAAWRISLIGATMIIALVVWFGGLALFLHLLIWSGVCVFVLVVGSSYGWWRAPLETAKNRYLKAGKRHLEDEPLCLSCPVLALRAPRDEASLIIGLSGIWQSGS